MNNDRDISLILAAALRYSFGRRSYIVPTIRDFLRRHKDNKFIKRDMRLYIADIERYLNDINAGDEAFTTDYDVKEWKNFLAELEKEVEA